MAVPTLAFHEGRQTQLRHDMVDDRPPSGCEPESDCAAGTLPYSKTAAAQSAVWMKIGQELRACYEVPQVASAERVLARQNGPTVLVGHSFSGMIVTEAGVHPNVSALVYVAARAPDAGEDYTALAKTYPTPPASAGVMFDGDEGRLSQEA